MKKLSQKLIKLLYVVIAPILGITATTMYFIEYGWGYTPVSLIIIIITLLALLNAVFFNAFMEKTVILPKIHTQYGFMIALGFAWQDKSLIIFVPFCIIELEWQK